MKMSVIVASKHGSTAEIGRAVAARLVAAGHEVEVRTPADVRDLDGVDAVVLGSGVYAGRWIKEARDLISRLGSELSTRPVWLFSSGPLGDPLKPAEDPLDAAGAVAATHAREHRVFPGRIDKDSLSFGERAIVRAVHATVGDFRDWPAVTAWADSIDAQLVEHGA